MNIDDLNSAYEAFKEARRLNTTVGWSTAVVLLEEQLDDDTAWHGVVVVDRVGGGIYGAFTEGG